jgi:transposase-like protein
MKINSQAKTQKGQQVMNLTEEQAREQIEKLLWTDGQPVCGKCGSKNAYKMQGKTCRDGLCRCRDCGKQFTVTVGTIFEDSHLPLSTWVKAIHLMATSKKGISSLQLMRNLGLGSYKTAWHLSHRIRLAMKKEPVVGLLKGDVQVDETFVGGKPRKGSPDQRGKGITKKQPVLVLVETGGQAISQPIANAQSPTLKPVMEENIDKTARIVTDQWKPYGKAAAQFTGGHTRVNHDLNEWVNEDGFTTNTAESYFALLKRGHYGTFHQMSKKHLHRYCDEFSFRWNGRFMKDAQRRDAAVKGAIGKRLMFKPLIAKPSADPKPGEQLPPFPL